MLQNQLFWFVCLTWYQPLRRMIENCFIIFLSFFLDHVLPAENVIHFQKKIIVACGPTLPRCICNIKMQQQMILSCYCAHTHATPVNQGNFSLLKIVTCQNFPLIKLSTQKWLPVLEPSNIKCFSKGSKQRQIPSKPHNMSEYQNHHCHSTSTISFNWVPFLGMLAYKILNKEYRFQFPII